MNRSKRLLVLGMALLAFSGTIMTVAAGIRTVKIGISEDPPKMSTDANGNPQGIFIDIIKEIANKAGWSIEYTNSTLDGCVHLLDSGKIDLLPDMMYSEQRAKKYYLNKLQVLPDWINVYKRNNSTISYMDDLNKKRVAVVSNSVEQELFYIKSLQLGIKPVVIPASDHVKAAALVESGGADAALLSRFFEKSGNCPKNVVPTGLFFHASGVYFAASDYKNKKLLDEIDDRIAAMENDYDSPYYKSLEKWLKGKRNAPALFALGRIALAEAILLLVAIFVIFLLQKRSAKIASELRHKTVLLQNALLSSRKQPYK